MKFIRKSENSLDKYKIKTLNNKKRIEKHNNFIDIDDKSLKDLFIDFYLKNKGEQPKDEVINLLLEIIDEEGENKNETH